MTLDPHPWDVELVPAWHCGSGTVFFSSEGRWGAHWLPWHAADGERYFDADAAVLHVLRVFPGRVQRWVADLLAAVVLLGQVPLSELDKYCRGRFARYLEGRIEMSPDVAMDAAMAMGRQGGGADERPRLHPACRRRARGPDPAPPGPRRRPAHRGTARRAPHTQRGASMNLERSSNTCSTTIPGVAGHSSRATRPAPRGGELWAN